MGELTYTPGSHLPLHTHPNEEAMLIIAGTLEAVLEDETCTVRAGDTVLAPSGITHGFTNRSSEEARMVWVHPVTEISMQWVDEHRPNEG
jgi:quercetin dioxygenase-like cupin family protein